MLQYLLTMKKVTLVFRWLLYSLLILILLAVAGYIILFSLGLKIDWQNLRLEETGMLFVKTQPTDAKVLIDNREFSDRTPIKIRWLVPGQYQLEITKEGYRSWQKRIEIESGMVTEEKKVRLFSEKPQQKKIAKADKVVVLEGQDSGYLFTDNKITFFSLSPERRKPIATLKKEIERIELNSDQTKVLINQQFVVNLLNGKTLIDLSQRYPQHQSFSFHPTNPRKLIGRYQKQLFLIDLYSRQKEKFWSIKKKSNQQLGEEGLWFLDKRKKIAVLSLKSWSGNSELIARGKIEVVAEEKQERGEEEKKKEINLTDLQLAKNGHQVFFRDQESRYYQLKEGKLNYLINQLLDINYSPDQSLLSNRVGELWLINSEERKLITRIINHPQRLNYLDPDYLTFLSQERVYITDYDGLNSFPVLSNNKIKIKEYWILDQNNLLIFTTKRELIKLELS